MHDLKLEKGYLIKVIKVLTKKIRDLEVEYSNYSPYIYAIGDMEDDWDFAIKKNKALRAKHIFPEKIQRLTTLKNAPFFGKIYIEDQHGLKQYYIGEEEIFNEHEYLVISWKSDFGDIFYKKLPIVTVNGHRLKLLKTRNFNISNGQLLDYKDYDVKENDLLKAYKSYISSDFLQKELVNRNAQKLKPIFQTIDQLQNEIIRMPLNQNVLVQGVSGSGKTTIGLQRLSYIIYQLEKKKTRSKILAICPNKLFLDYIQELVPNLNLKNVEFTSVKNLFLSFLPDGITFAKSKIKDDLTYHLLNSLNENLRNLYSDWFQFKGSKEYIELLEDYVQELKLNFINNDFSTIHHIMSKTFMLDVFGKFKHHPYNEVITKSIDYIEDHFKRQNIENIDDIFPSIKQKISKNKLNNLKKVYMDFLSTNASLYREDFEEPTNNQINKGIFYEEDSPALIYLSLLLDNVTIKKNNFNHIFIDEAQDLTYIQYLVLKRIYKKACFTIVGDLNQQVFLQRGIGSWDHITPIFKYRKFELQYNYRSTKEIMALATSCLIDPIYKGNGVLETAVKPLQLIFNNKQSRYNIWRKVYKEYFEKWFNNNESIAIITNSIEESENVENILNEIGVVDTNVIYNTECILDSAKITIISALQVKGLEFNNIIVYNPSEDAYPDNSYYSKLLYMVFTRALYNIIFIAVDPPTKLLQSADLNYLFESKTFESMRM